MTRTTYNVNLELKRRQCLNLRSRRHGCRVGTTHDETSHLCGRVEDGRMKPRRDRKRVRHRTPCNPKPRTPTT